jgi:hypothetical protein
MARNSHSALYINDPVKIVAGVFTIRQAVYVVGIVVLTYALINATSRLPYGQSGLGQLHLLLIVGVPALLGLLVVTFAGSGTVEPYARQIAGYLWRTALALPRRLAYRAARLVSRPRAACVYGPVLVAAAGSVAPVAEAVPLTTPIRAVCPVPTPYVAPVLLTTPVAQTQRARLLAWLTAHPCVTDEQIAEGAGLNPSAARPRRRELVDAGVVRKVDMDGRTRAGRRAARWAVVGKPGEVVAHG